MTKGSVPLEERGKRRVVPTEESVEERLEVDMRRTERSKRETTRHETEYAGKYRVYERDYLRRINHKYFSGKNQAGTGRVFEICTIVENFIVKESSEIPIKNFLETPSSADDHTRPGAVPYPAKKSVIRKS